MSAPDLDERPPEDDQDAFIKEKGIERWEWGCCRIAWRRYLDDVVAYRWECLSDDCDSVGGNKYTREKAIRGALAHAFQKHNLQDENSGTSKG